MRLKIFIIAVLLSVTGPSLLRGADNIRFSNISVYNGLTHNSVFDVFQDDRGFMWISTQKGLCRYDGYTIRKYFNITDDPTSIPHNTVRSVSQDSKGRLWVCTERGIALYDRDRDNFRQYDMGGDNNIIVYRFFETSSGKYLAASNNGLYIYDPAKDDFLPMFSLMERSPLPLNIFAVAEDRSGILWLATNKGLKCFDLDKRKVVEIVPDTPTTHGMLTETLYTVFRDGDKRMLLGGWRGVLIYDLGSGAATVMDNSNGLSVNIVRALEFDADSNLWIGGENGIDIVGGDGHIRHIAQGAADISNLSDNAIYVIRRDNEGNMWVGTYFGGVNVMFRHAGNFSTYPYGFSDRHISGKAVRQIIRNDDHTLWIATEDGGLDFFDRRSGVFSHYRTMKDKVAVNYYNIHSLLKDRSGKLWIGTFSGGINRYDPATGRTEYLKCVRDGVEASMIFCLNEASDGDVWIGTSNGLFVWHKKDGRIIPEAKVELQTFIYSMAFDSHGLLWIGTRRNGLYRYDIDNNQVTHIKSDDQFQNFVTSVFVDRGDDIWVGTNDGGLRYLERGKDKFTSFTVKDGLPSNSVMAIVQDNDGNIWISTDNGLCRMDTTHGRMENFTVDDGLPINLFNYSSAFKADDGELFFGSVNGMISFYPDRLMTKKSKLDVEITGFRIGGKEVPVGGKGSPLHKNITETSHITITHRQALSFGFTYTAVNFSNTSNIQYSIQLVGGGGNKDWQNVGNQHQVLFSNLPHGNYRLAIRASYDGVHWDESGTRYLDITIRPPFFLSVWAYLLYLIVLAAIALLAYNIVAARLKMRDRIREESSAKVHAEELNRHKMTFFGNISHDLKTPLLLILGPLQKLIGEKETDGKQRSKLSIVLQNAQRMRSLLDEMVMLSKIDMGQMKITVQQGDLLNYIDNICNIFRVFAADSGISFFVSMDPARKEVWFSRTNIERIVYNLLSNAFKFTPPGGVIRVHACMYVDETGSDRLSFTVKDTGCGIAHDLQEKIFENYYTFAGEGRHNGYGIGLALTKSLVELHHGSIGVESEPGEGATFTVTLNVSKNAYNESQISKVRIENNDPLSEEYFAENNIYLHQAREEIQAHQSKRFQILVVEDNRELNEFVKQIFVKDFDVVSAFDGNEGYEKAVQMMPDIIISDVMMPGMNGLELTRKLKSELLTSHIPVILLTARVEENDKIEGFECGADAYVEKPFNIHTLELQVSNMLNTKNSNIQHFKHDARFDSKKLAYNPRDEKFLNSIIDLIMKNLDNDQFAVKDITDALGMSRSLLHIKLKNLADLSVTEFIRNIRMKEAREKLISGMNVSETSFAVGISDPNYFTKCFKRQFGQTPSEFLKLMGK